MIKLYVSIVSFQIQQCNTVNRLAINRVAFSNDESLIGRHDRSAWSVKGSINYYFNAWNVITHDEEEEGGRNCFLAFETKASRALIFQVPYYTQALAHVRELRSCACNITRVYTRMR